ncbi:hypothetical protein KFZ70_04225 [Tamlana fucoidanivorans]|uniref:Uncharacterized protein n=1 Tax=Allotamlana fucoidanivorans TaxID=2583814 RepID=A0A5C4SCT2_9FLAO|nr:hypothetical protein [Tamlana fucoidanivorans]TNJ41350.1 hypothetical protein FGF67_16080 [Tamlana fucoidanivorans]
MEQIIFKVKTRVRKEINWTLEEQRRFPVHEHHLHVEKTFDVVYDYKPTSKFDKVKFIQWQREVLLNHENVLEVLIQD